MTFYAAKLHIYFCTKTHCMWTTGQLKYKRTVNTGKTGKNLSYYVHSIHEDK